MKFKYRQILWMFSQSVSHKTLRIMPIFLTWHALMLLFSSPSLSKLTCLFLFCSCKLLPCHRWNNGAAALKCFCLQSRPLQADAFRSFRTRKIETGSALDGKYLAMPIEMSLPLARKSCKEELCGCHYMKHWWDWGKKRRWRSWRFVLAWE